MVASTMPRISSSAWMCSAYRPSAYLTSACLTTASIRRTDGRGIGHYIEPAQRLPEISERLDVGPAALGFFRGGDRLIDRLFSFVAAAEIAPVIPPPVGSFAIEFFEGLHDRTMIGATVPLQEATIGGFLGQRTAEE